jgi:hypothetical protein
MARLFYSSFLVFLSTLLPLLTVQAHDAWPGSFTCPANTKQALAPTLNANGLCDCAEGWAGPECGVCTTNDACAIVHGEGATCAQTSFAGEKKLVRTCCVFVVVGGKGGKERGAGRGGTDKRERRRKGKGLKP